MSPRLTGPASSRTRDVHAGRLLLGLALAALGVLWLLQALDVATIDWNLGLPIGVIAIGAALLVAGFLGRGSGGLVVLGIAFTVLLLASTVVDVPLGGGVGDRTYRPTTVRSRSYELAMGQLTIDLTRIELPETLPAEIRASAHVGVGQLLVLVPQRFPCVATHAKSGIGGIDVFGRSRDGFGAESRTDAVCSAAPLIHLDLTVGIGEVEVRRG